MRIYSQIRKITESATVTRIPLGPVKNKIWRLDLSCGHYIYEQQRKRPSLWSGPEVLGRRRRKECIVCSEAK